MVVLGQQSCFLQYTTNKFVGGANTFFFNEYVGDDLLVFFTMSLVAVQNP